MIQGVEIKTLVRHADERGFFQEIIRVSDDFFKEGFGQWSMARMHQGIVKAWHLHKIQCDWWFVARGTLKAVLYDAREESSTYGELQECMMGEDTSPMVLKIPPGVYHGCKVIQGPCDLFYITSKTYNPDDELRFPHDDPAIGYDWLAGPEIK